MRRLFASFVLICFPLVASIEAVIFDCDGVLVDTESLKFLAWQEALSSQGIDFSIEEYMPLVGHSGQNILLRIQESKGREIGKEVIELRNATYRWLQAQGVSPFPLMVAFVKQLSLEDNFLLGLASSAPMEEILHNLQQIGLKEAFDLIISGADDLSAYSDVEGTNKPKPYIYLEAAKRLGVSPSKCLVFEDTSAGVEAAAGAGMIAIAVPNSFTSQQDFSQATYRLDASTEASLSALLLLEKT